MPQKAIIDITVSPRSSKSSVLLQENNSIKVYLTVPPVDGKANSALIDILSKKLNTQKSKIKIVLGKSSKKKRLQIDDMTVDEILSKLRHDRSGE